MGPKGLEGEPKPEEFINERSDIPEPRSRGVSEEYTAESTTGHREHEGERTGYRSQRSFDAAYRALGELIDELDFAKLGPELGRDLQQLGRRNPVVAAATAFAAGAMVGYAVDRFSRGTRRWGMRKGIAPSVRDWVRRAS